MAAWIWILIAIGVLVVLGLIVFGMRRNREKVQRPPRRPKRTL